MNEENLSLDQLHDVVNAAPVPWWPLATMWWVIILLLGASSFAFWAKRWLLSRATAYQRSALRELRGARRATEVSAILKRAAMQVFPRNEVAHLSGTPWYLWCTQFADGSDQVQAELLASVADGTQLSSDELVRFARACIKGLPERTGRFPNHASQ